MRSWKVLLDIVLLDLLAETLMFHQTQAIKTRQMQNIIYFHKVSQTECHPKFVWKDTLESVSTHHTRLTPSQKSFNRRLVKPLLFQDTGRPGESKSSPQALLLLLLLVLALLYLVHGLCSHCLVVWTEPLSFNWNFLPSALSISFSQIHTCL